MDLAQIHFYMKESENNESNLFTHAQRTAKARQQRAPSRTSGYVSDLIEALFLAWSLFVFRESFICLTYLLTYLYNGNCELKQI